MDRVARVELYHVAVPLPAPFYPSWIPGFPQTENRFDLIRVVTESGIEGFSAGPAFGKERAGLGEVIGPYLIGEDSADIAGVQQRLRELGYLGWRNWWIEPAFWDIAGKRANKPVWQLLGGTDPGRVEVYASTGEVKSGRERIAEAEARYAEGYRAIKLRVHDFDEAVDLAQVRETAAALGGKMKLGVDANQAWRVCAIANAPIWDLERAKRFADACAELGVAWLEEPLPMDAYDDLVALTAYSKIDIAGGELHSGARPELEMMIDRRCYDIFQPDAMFTGGILQTLAIARHARARGLAYTPHTWTNGYGFAVNLQLMAASGFAGEKALEFPINPPSWIPEARDGTLAEPFIARDGFIEMPKRPGLGFEVDWRALRRYGKRFFVMDRKRLVFFALRDRGLRVAREIDARRRERRKRQAASSPNDQGGGAPYMP
jgi:L-alanine-DL-glutamate epimerase-like enolase superfamily enzyme